MKLRILLIVLCLSLWSSLAHAHATSVAYLDSYADAHGAGTVVELDIAVRDVALSLPLDADRDEIVTWGEVLALRPRIEAWAEAGLTLTSSQARCALTADSIAIRRYDQGAYIALRLRTPCPIDAALRLRYELLFAQDPQHRAIYAVRQAADTRTGVLTPELREFAIDDAQRAGFAVFLREGVHHILIGYDHLAFLLSLLLPAALVRSDRSWRPVERPFDGFLHALGIVTAFTVAHSITLSLAALGWVVPASRPVEAAIAASVLLAALNNLRPLIVRRLWLAGFGFGLIHGFGFAGALSELGLPADSRTLALLGFNLGVELGQIAVVCLLLPILLALRARAWYVRGAMPALSLAIAGLAGVWLSQRLSA
jgi:HupE / UreJ protein